MAIHHHTATITLREATRSASGVRTEIVCPPTSQVRKSLPPSFRILGLRSTTDIPVSVAFPRPCTGTSPDRPAASLIDSDRSCQAPSLPSLPARASVTTQPGDREPRRARPHPVSALRNQGFAGQKQKCPSWESSAIDQGVVAALGTKLAAIRRRVNSARPHDGEAGDRR